MSRSPQNLPIGIAGAGRIGQALGRLLRDRGERVIAVAGRDLTRTQQAAAFIGAGVKALAYAELPAHAGRILIAVPDDALAEVAAVLARSPHPPQAAVHTCGSRGPEALSPLQAIGVSCAALHPLQTAATPEQALAALPGSGFAIDGTGPAKDWAFEICRMLNGTPLEIAAETRPLYHAAAVMASNYVIALLDAAVILMREAGIGQEEALQALGPLARASVENALALGPLQALTGPIERGDAGTVSSHLRAMGEVSEDIRELYRRAGLYTAQMARRKIRGADRGEIESILREDREK
ncbi:MAG TPA: Rossmann-like and DUF2520 domain-containing protein [Bryobacteraceae bacterium]|nr:Rossmann-like and DUF2520 domain-containing protein [Bryobacteraceae bacterium]